ncbi:MAG: glycosyltransferase family 2 protein [Bacillota bacterium]|jgi:cellulose synthase/poly-beta-1,6-N-acetylglucosamine synthase-like glycosyltransferase
MTTAQSLYLAAFSVYLVFFLLFSRFLVWKTYSEKKYWNWRLVLNPSSLEDTAKALERPVPFVSIMVPARNESLVIDNTIRHLTSLSYPVNRFEVVVVTDEKETQAAESDRVEISALVHNILMGEQPFSHVPAHLETCLKSVLLSTLSEYALREYLSKGFQKDYPTGTPELCSLPAYERHSVVRDIAIALVSSHGAPPRRHLRAIIRRRCPWLSELDIDRVYPAFLAVAVPVIAAYATLCDESQRRTLDRTIQHTVKANHDLTQDIIRRMTSFVAKRVSISIQRASRTGELQAKVRVALLDLYPTTQEVVDRAMREMQGEGVPSVKHVTVPYDFDGSLGGKRTGEEVASTKGRALNWGIAYLDPQVEVVGFYDAESRPHKDVLLYVGYRRMLDPESSQVLQGPVFQVRNFYKMTPFCRIAALYQAVAHDWYLPWLFRTLPFVGGTNVFIAKSLLCQVGGWDCEVLTEDLEFGTRAYLRKGAWPEYLPYPSSEQTPPTFRAFFRQRLRWGTGHLQVVRKVAEYQGIEPSAKSRLRRNLIIKGQAEWILYQIATFVPPVAMVLHYKDLLDPTIVPVAGQWMLSGFSLLYMSFTIYAFGRYRGYMDVGGQPETVIGKILVYVALLLLPLAAFVFPIPYTSAMLLKFVGKEPKVWVKTPRTEETRMAL